MPANILDYSPVLGDNAYASDGDDSEQRIEVVEEGPEEALIVAVKEDIEENDEQEEEEEAEEITYDEEDDYGYDEEDENEDENYGGSRTVSEREVHESVWYNVPSTYGGDYYNFPKKSSSKLSPMQFWFIVNWKNLFSSNI